MKRAHFGEYLGQQLVNITIKNKALINTRQNFQLATNESGTCRRDLTFNRAFVPGNGKDLLTIQQLFVRFTTISYRDKINN